MVKEKKKVGRPQATSPLLPITFYVPLPLMDAIKRRATSERREVSRMVRLIVEESIEQKGARR